MAAISNNNIARAIYLALREKSDAEQSLFLKDVVQFLSRRRLLSKSADILARLNKIINDEEGRIAVKVWSAEKLTEQIKKELKQSLAKRYEGKEIVLEENLNESLLGGLRIEVNDEVLDLSFKNRMKKLQDYLTKSK